MITWSHFEGFTFKSEKIIWIKKSTEKKLEFFYFKYDSQKISPEKEKHNEKFRRDPEISTKHRLTDEKTTLHKTRQRNLEKSLWKRISIPGRIVNVLAR